MDGHRAVPNQEQDDAAESRSPRLALAGFSGPLGQLLALARARQVDLARLSLSDLVDQLAVALQQATAAIPLSEKADWVVMAAWLVQLRSLLLLPIEAPARKAATVEADQLRGQLVTLRTIQTLADWLERRPQLGCDVFARGQPEMFGVSIDDSAPAIDMIGFLWASLALFDDEPLPDTANVYYPRPLELYDVAEAREHILRRLADIPQGYPLERLLPDEGDPVDGEPPRTVRRRSAWSSTFVASLELAKQGTVVLGQERHFQPVHVTLSQLEDVTPNPGSSLCPPVALSLANCWNDGSSPCG